MRNLIKNSNQNQTKITIAYRCGRVQIKKIMAEANLISMDLDEVILWARTFLNAQDWLQFNELHLVDIYEIQQHSILQKLIKWKRDIAYAKNGASPPENLNEIRQLFKKILNNGLLVFDLLEKVISQFTEEDTFVHIFQENLLRMRRLLSTLVCENFIVVEQPPQVLKKGSKFSAIIESLLEAPNIMPNSLSCQILNVEQAQDYMFDTIFHEPNNSGEIKDNNAKLRICDNKCFAEFKDMIVKDINRANGRSVLEEKFCFVFYGETTLFGNAVMIKTFSLPVVITVHGAQDDDANATIFWDNGFSKIQRKLFEVESVVLWKDFKTQLNNYFGLITERKMTENNLQYLHMKIFSRPEQPHTEVTYEQIFRNKGQHNHTFWKWLCAIMKLIKNSKNSLQEMWKKSGVIEGFISRQQVETEILPHQRPGTFIIRFADSALGLISIAHLTQEGVIKSLSFQETNLQIESLAHFILKDAKIRFLYNHDHLKLEEIFYDLCTKQEKNQKDQNFIMNGYVGVTGTLSVCETDSEIPTSTAVPSNGSSPNENNERLFSPSLSLMSIDDTVESELYTYMQPTGNSELSTDFLNSTAPLSSITPAMQTLNTTLDGSIYTLDDFFEDIDQITK